MVTRPGRRWGWWYKQTQFAAGVRDRRGPTKSSAEVSPGHDAPNKPNFRVPHGAGRVFHLVGNALRRHYELDCGANKAKRRQPVVGSQSENELCKTNPIPVGAI